MARSAASLIAALLICLGCGVVCAQSTDRAQDDDDRALRLSDAVNAHDQAAVTRLLASLKESRAPKALLTPALFDAVYGGDGAMVGLLLSAGADPNRPNEAGRLPLL